MTYNSIEGSLDAPASAEIIESLSSDLGVSLPAEYLDFLRQHNGGEGFIGQSYIVLWKAEQIIDFNREYEVEKYAPGIILFGSSGGGEGYGFDAQSADIHIVRIPFIGMNRRYAKFVATKFSSLFSHIGANL